MTDVPSYYPLPELDAHARRCEHCGDASRVRKDGLCLEGQAFRRMEASYAHIASDVEILLDTKNRMRMAHEELLATAKTVLESAGYLTGRAEPGLRELSVSRSSLDALRRAVL